MTGTTTPKARYNEIHSTLQGRRLTVLEEAHILPDFVEAVAIELGWETPARVLKIGQDDLTVGGPCRPADLSSTGGIIAID